MRIGIFGGSFDPVHLGHLIVAEAAADRLRLDRIHFVPAGKQPFKVAGHVAAVDDRVAMLKLAIAGNARFVIDQRETRRTGPSYTVDTLRGLRVDLPSDELFLLVGADAAQEISTWREAATLATLATLAVLTRPGFSSAPKGEAVAVAVPAIDISATMVREYVRKGNSIRYLVPAGVADYIAAHRLYGAGTSC